MITAETIERIIRFDGGDLPVVSLYARVGQDGQATLATRLNGLLHEIRPLGRDSSLGRQARMSIRGDIDRIEGLAGLGGLERAGPGSVAVFSCSEADLFEQVMLPRTVRDRVMVDATPWVRPMLAVLDEYHRACVLVLDRRSAEAWELYQDEMREAGKVEDPALRRPIYAGWHGRAEHRVRNRVDDLARRHFRTTARLVDELFRTGRYEVIILGGHPGEMTGFADFLPADLRPKIAGTFTIDPRTATPADIRRGAEHVLRQYERAEERRWVAEVLDRVATRRPAALGLADCLWAGSVAAVRTLLVREGAPVPGVVCDESGWLGSAGDACPLCGKATRSTADVIGELADAVIEEGGAVEHLLDGAELEEHLVAAALRFSPPPPPEPSA
ncbi:hypothetical protein [Sphaerisporangium dianthi]|uniref:Peptide chain release factor subunit 1 n=1 Tax=Sphaerisporangium dianthi TaxID=1436120 RepID=A0ABV9CNW5_9ACTN